MTSRSKLTVIALLCGICGAQAATDSAGYSPPNQMSALQPQADRLATSISAVVRSAEASTKTLSSTDKEATIQTAIQSAIMASGDDPRVVLATLEAFALCPTTAGRYSVTQIPVTCTDLKGPLSPEAREALASLEKVIVALVDQTEAPGALGSGGVAPFVSQPGNGEGGGGRSGAQANASGAPGATSPGSSSAIDSQPGPGGGGTSGYNTN